MHADKSLADKSLKILIVCTGNICRSPTAEALLRHHLSLAGLDRQVEVDSAGTDGYHVGEAPSREAVACATARGYDLSGLRARQLASKDFDDFDLILAMDRHHLHQLEHRRPKGAACKLALFLSVLPEAGEVQDPYYGGRADYEHMLDTIEGAVPAWIEAFRRACLPGDDPGS